MFDLIGMIHAAGPAAILIIMLIVFCETGLLVGFFLPGDSMLFITGVLVYRNVIPQHLLLVIIGVALAAILGDQLGYTIGKRGGPAVFERKESGIFSKKTVEKTQHFYEKYGNATVGIARFIGLVRTISPVMAGVGKMPRLKFTLWSVIGSLAWPTVVIGAGYLLAHFSPRVGHMIERYIDLILFGIVATCVIPLLIKQWRLSWKERKEK